MRKLTKARKTNDGQVYWVLDAPIYYEENGITIYNADCLELLKRFGDNEIDLILTDPPYKIAQKYGSSIDPDNLRAVSGLLLVLPLLEPLLKEGRFLVSFYDNRILSFLFECARNTKLTYQKSIYVYRRWGNAHKWGGWMQTTDPICFFRKYSENKMRWYGKNYKHDCYIKASPEPDTTGHPAQKPIEVIRDIIEWCTAEGQLILDPYAGSGTILKAAKELGRRAIGIEINERYCEMAVRRLQQVELQLN